MNRICVVVFCIGLIAGVASTFYFSGAHVAAQPKGVDLKWEYKVIQFQALDNLNPKSDCEQMATELNKLASDRWEYVGVVAAPIGDKETRASSWAFVAFRRPKK